MFARNKPAPRKSVTKVRVHKQPIMRHSTASTASSSDSVVTIHVEDDDNVVEPHNVTSSRYAARFMSLLKFSTTTPPRPARRAGASGRSSIKYANAALDFPVESFEDLYQWHQLYEYQYGWWCMGF